MGIFDKFFGRRQRDDGDDMHTMPWDERPSIFEHVRSHVDPSAGGLTEGGETLPDEERMNASSQLRWAAGALDGVATHHLESGEQEEQIQQAVDLVLAFCEQPTAANKLALYQNIIDENTVSIIDPVIATLIAEERLNHQRLYELAYSFVTEAADREPVKFGIAILGLFEQAENNELFQTLGRHDEFTLYCAVALANSSDDPDRSLWTLARNVDGWGRIHVVERLSETSDPEVKDWLLREGYRNSVMYEYLAYTCATAGGLLEALSADRVDRDLLTSSGEIIQALIIGGPAESMDHYEDGALVAERFLRHIDENADTIADFLHVNAIRSFLDDNDADWKCRLQLGWTEQHRSRLLAMCDSILTRPHWIERVNQDLSSEAEGVFFQANQAAGALGIYTWEHHWRRLQDKPTDSLRWYYVMALVSDQRLPQVLDAAQKSIDLTSIATGPADDFGVGPGYEPHSCLDYLLQELRRFPGQGEDLIEAGLKSPVVRNRNMAVAALAEWTPERWSTSTREALQSAIQIEPDDDVRDRMTKALNGEPLDD